MLINSFTYFSSQKLFLDYRKTVPHLAIKRYARLISWNKWSVLFSDYNRTPWCEKLTAKSMCNNECITRAITPREMIFCTSHAHPRKFQFPSVTFSSHGGILEKNPSPRASVASFQCARTSFVWLVLQSRRPHFAATASSRRARSAIAAGRRTAATRAASPRGATRPPRRCPAPSRHAPFAVPARWVANDCLFFPPFFFFFIKKDKWNAGKLSFRISADFCWKSCRVTSKIVLYLLIDILYKYYLWKLHLSEAQKVYASI